MAEETTDRSEGIFPGWLPSRNLLELVQLVESTSRLEPSTQKDPEAGGEGRMKGGPLLAGRGLQVSSRPTRDDSASPPSSHGATTTQIPVHTKSGQPRGGVWIKLAIGGVAVAGLLVFAWVVMSSSDYSDVATIKGERFESDQLAVEPGELLPSFAGLLLVDNPDRWGDTLSDQDLVGKNTVMLIWGSWNEDLVSWSQDLNYIRLVDFEDKDVQFVGLNLDKSRDVALASLNDDLKKWPHLFNADERKAEEERPMFRLGVRSSPLILLIDSTGRLRAQGLEPGEVVQAYKELFE